VRFRKFDLVMKSYTDLPQSKKLAEFLPLESADMCYSNDGTAIKIDANPYTVRYSMWKDCVAEIIPCWSLASLLDVLPILERKGYQKAKPRLLYNVAINKWIIDSHIYTTDAYDNPVDACVEMIEKLNELKML
jgi:hypothetical protein